MARFFYVTRPSKWIGFGNGTAASSEDEWHEKARALQYRRWKAIRKADRKVPSEEHGQKKAKTHSKLLVPTNTL